MKRHQHVGRTAAVLAGGAVFWLVCSTAVRAELHYGSLALQNDLFLGRDGGGYTNGIFLSSIRMPSPDEESVAPPLLLSGPVAGWLGLSGATLSASSLGQVMITPKDITRRHPDPSDTPYVGALMYRSAQVHVRGDVADMAALSVGVVGPASGAEQAQKLVHRIVGADRPEGWGTQVSNKPLVGIERYRAWRFADGRGGGIGSDVILQGGGTVGSLESSVGGSVLFRYGTRLARSFPTTMRVSSSNADPFVIGPGWFVFAGLSADRMLNHTSISRSSPSLDGAARLRKTRTIMTLGVAYGWARSSLTFSLQSVNPLMESSTKRQSYGSLTYVFNLDR